MYSRAHYRLFIIWVISDGNRMYRVSGLSWFEVEAGGLKAAEGVSWCLWHDLFGPLKVVQIHFGCWYSWTKLFQVEFWKVLCPSAHLAANFLNFPKLTQLFILGWFWSKTQISKNIENQKNSYLSKFTLNGLNKSEKSGKLLRKTDL